jgi:hypothetical protein
MTKLSTRSFLWACLASTMPMAAIADLLQLEHTQAPVGPGAEEPMLSALTNGRLAMSWAEPDADGFAVKMAILDGQSWGSAQTIVRSESLFVNWADFPSIIDLPDGTLAAHWLQGAEPYAYEYDVNIALSSDDGATWGQTIVPHRDGTTAQHGFASLLPVTNDQFLTIWLDGRAYGNDETFGLTRDTPDAMQLRSTQIRSDGTLSEDIVLDNQTCSCCQTSAAATSDGTLLVAYRDRTDAEIRDIAVVRHVAGEWMQPNIVHEDGWKISGCPVNGPAIDTFGETAVVAWFTAANDVPAVKVAFSTDNGESFDAPILMDFGGAIGRIDAMMLDDSRALITWVEWTGSAEVLYACTVSIDATCDDPHIITTNNGSSSVNFPRMARIEDRVYLAWTQALEGGSGSASKGTTIRVVSFAP